MPSLARTSAVKPKARSQAPELGPLRQLRHMEAHIDGVDALGNLIFSRILLHILILSFL